MNKEEPTDYSNTKARTTENKTSKGPTKQQI
jgi:hypothetical protein